MKKKHDAEDRTNLFYKNDKVCCLARQNTNVLRKGPMSFLQETISSELLQKQH